VLVFIAKDTCFSPEARAFIKITHFIERAFQASAVNPKQNFAAWTYQLTADPNQFFLHIVQNCSDISEDK
jgi:hypothetical protein